MNTVDPAASPLHIVPYVSMVIMSLGTDPRTAHEDSITIHTNDNAQPVTCTALSVSLGRPVI